MQYVFFVCIFAILSILQTTAQTFTRTIYNVESDFQLDIIKCMAQDSLGYMWIGSDEGLCRFDGKQIRFYQEATESPYIKYFLRLKNGNLLVVDDLGINEICSRSDTTIFAKRISGSYLINDSTVNTPKSIFEDSKDRLWVADGRGLAVFDKGKLKKYSVEKYNLTLNFTQSYQHSVFYIEHNNIIWAITSGGKLYYFSESGDSIVPTKIDTKIWGVSQFIHATENRYWISCNNGLYELQLFTDSVYTKQLLNLQGLSSITSYTDSLFFVSSYMGDLYRLHILPNGNTLSQKTDYSFSLINFLYTDNYHNLWVCTNEGIQLLQEQFFRHIGLKNLSLLDASYDFQAFMQSEDGLFYSVSGDRLYEVIITNDTIQHKPILHFLQGNIGEMYPTRKGFWLENTKGEVFFYDKQKQYTRYILPNNSEIANQINDLQLDCKGNLWLCNKFSGIIRIDTAFNLSFYNQKYNFSAEIISLEQTPDGDFYFGSKTDSTYLLKYISLLDTFINVSLPLPPKFRRGNFEITDMKIDAQAMLWLATPFGLLKYNTELQTITEVYLQEYNGENIRAVTTSLDGSVWLAIRYGLLRLKNGEVSLYNKESGLISNTIPYRSLETDSYNRIWAASMNGNSISKPVPNFIPKTFTPLFSDIRINGQKINNRDAILELPHNSYIEGKCFTPIYPTKNITYNLTIINAEDTIHKKIDGRYWILPNLNSGDYILNIQARHNGHGLQWSQPAVLYFSVQKAWYMQIWAIIILTFFLVIIVWLIVKLNTWRLKKDRDRLEKEVNLRTHEIKEQNVILEQQKEEILTQTEELRNTNDKLQQLDEFKQNMTSMIVHDLKNSLNAIINPSALLSLQSQLAQTKQAGQQMLNMVLNILDVYKYENSNMNLDQNTESVYKIAQNAIAQVMFLSESKSILIHNLIEPQHTALLDNEIIERVFINLLTNAIKYTPNNGSIKLYSTLHTVDNITSKTEVIASNDNLTNNRSFVKISVCDMGTGIPKEKLHNVFDKFSQIEAKKSGMVRSTGLGLAFCKMAVEAHDGKIGVESQIGKGSEFWFTLIYSDNKIDYSNLYKVQPPASKNLTIMFTPLEKEYLIPFVTELQRIEIYEITSIRNILKDITYESENIDKWKNAILQTAIYFNQELYITLLKNISE